MNFVRAAGTLVVGLLPLLAGCAPMDTDMEDAEDVGAASQAEGNGTQNGLDPEDANPCWTDIAQSMDVPVYENGTINLALPSSVRGGKCVAAFAYAQQCAALLSTATDWFYTSGLGDAAKQEVMACMLALVNTISGVEVCMSGEHIIGGGVGSCYGQNVQEAVWQTILNRDGTVSRYLWPLQPSLSCISSAMDDVFASRLCGPNAQEPLDCGVELRPDIEVACSHDGDTWTCANAPAMLTKIGATDWLTLFPECDPIPQ